MHTVFFFVLTIIRQEKMRAKIARWARAVACGLLAAVSCWSDDPSSGLPGHLYSHARQRAALLTDAPFRAPWSGAAPAAGPGSANNVGRRRQRPGSRLRGVILACVCVCARARAFAAAQSAHAALVAAAVLLRCVRCRFPRLLRLSTVSTAGRKVGLGIVRPSPSHWCSRASGFYGAAAGGLGI